MVVVLTTIPHLTKRLIDVQEDDDINNGDEKQEECRNRCTYQSTKRFQKVKITDGNGSYCNKDRQKHYDRRMAKGEEEANRDWSFILLHQFASDIING